MRAIYRTPVAAICMILAAASHPQAKPVSTQLERQTLEQQVLAEGSAVEAHLALSKIYRREGDHQLAIAVMQNALKRQPANEDVLAQLGYALIDAGEFKEAIAVFDKLTAINHQSVSGYNGKAVAFDKAGNHTAAQELYQQALRIDPNSAQTINNLALSYILDLKPEQSIKLLEPWMKQDNAPANMRYNLALAYGVSGNADKARQLNLEVMSEKEADKNQAFYERYAEMLKQDYQKSLNRVAVLDSEPVNNQRADKMMELEPAAGNAPSPAEEQVDQAKGNSFLGYEAETNYPVARTR